MDKKLQAKILENNKEEQFKAKKMREI